jgi:hypothetical protein
LVKQIKSGYIGRFRSHHDNPRELVAEEIGSIGRSGGEMYNSDLFACEVGKIHDASLFKSLVNRLRLLESDLVFVDDNENIFKILDFLNKLGKLIAVKDRVMVLGREALSGLVHPIDGRESGDNENMLMRYLLNDSEHGARFAGLRESHSENREDVRIKENVGNIFAETVLVRKHIVGYKKEKVKKDVQY